MRPKPLETTVITPSILYVGTPVAVVSTRGTDGRTNLSVISSVWALHDRLVMGLGLLGAGFQNLERERECVVNFPSASQWVQVEAIAPTTGSRDVPSSKKEMGYSFEEEKFSRAGWTAAPSDTVQPQRVIDCPLQVEAAVLNIHACAGIACAIVEVQAQRVHAHPNIIQAGTNRIDPQAWQPLLYVFRHYFGTGPELGRNFRAET